MSERSSYSCPRGRACQFYKDGLPCEACGSMPPPPDRIRIRCRTNLDEYATETWPTSLPAVPELRQLVQAKSGKRLYVVGLCWLFDGTLEVELHR